MMNIKKDKIDHAVYSFTICMILCMIAHSLKTFIDISPLSMAFMAGVITMVIGILKEVKDKYDPNHKAELADVIADGVGVLAAMVLFVIGV